MSFWRLCATSGFGDEILSAEGSQERERLVNEILSAEASQERGSFLQKVRKSVIVMLAPFFVQLLALGMMSCLQRVCKSVNVLFAASSSHRLWQSGLWPFGETIYLVRRMFAKSVNILLAP